MMDFETWRQRREEIMREAERRLRNLAAQSSRKDASQKEAPLIGVPALSA